MPPLHFHYLYHTVIIGPPPAASITEEYLKGTLNYGTEMPTNATPGLAPAASITKEYLKGALNYGTEMPTNATPGSAALHRLHTCLSAANLTGYFQSRGLLVAAERNAESLFNVLGRIIPKELGSSGLKSHCWKEETEFRVVRQYEGHTMKRLTADSEVISQAKSSAPFLTIKGHIGSLPITFHPSKYYWNDDQYDFVLELLNLLDNYSSSITCAARVFLAGFTKCGTTFLYNMITSHPLMVKPGRKEPKWWHTVPITNSHPNLTALYVMRYFMHFESLAKAVLYDSPNALTIDATPGTMYKWPGVSKQITNFCLLPTVIPEILPKSKFIVIMRNPPDLLYSAFWYSCTHRGGHVTVKEKLQGPHIFHERIVAKINKFNACLQLFSAEKCAYDMYAERKSGYLERCGNTRMGEALYFVHVKKWLSVVPRERFTFLRLEDLSSDIATTMTKVWDFIGVPPSENYAKLLVARENVLHDQRQVDYKHNPKMMMWNSTRELLVKFFHPYNEKLVDLIKDRNFLWENC